MRGLEKSYEDRQRGQGPSRRIQRRIYGCNPMIIILVFMYLFLCWKVVVLLKQVLSRFPDLSVDS